jgi:hypothetical protein
MALDATWCRDCRKAFHQSCLTKEDICSTCGRDIAGDLAEVECLEQAGRERHRTQSLVAWGFIAILFAMIPLFLVFIGVGGEFVGLLIAGWLFISVILVSAVQIYVIAKAFTVGIGDGLLCLIPWYAAYFVLKNSRTLFGNKLSMKVWAVAAILVSLFLIATPIIEGYQ